MMNPDHLFFDRRVHFFPYAVFSEVPKMFFLPLKKKKKKKVYFFYQNHGISYFPPVMACCVSVQRSVCVCARRFGTPQLRSALCTLLSDLISSTHEEKHTLFQPPPDGGAAGGSCEGGLRFLN